VLEQFLCYFLATCDSDEHILQYGYFYHTIHIWLVTAVSVCIYLNIAGLRQGPGKMLPSWKVLEFFCNQETRSRGPCWEMSWMSAERYVGRCCWCMRLVYIARSQHRDKNIHSTCMLPVLLLCAADRYMGWCCRRNRLVCVCVCSPVCYLYCYCVLQTCIWADAVDAMDWCVCVCSPVCYLYCYCVLQTGTWAGAVDAMDWCVFRW